LSWKRKPKERRVQRQVTTKRYVAALYIKAFLELPFSILSTNISKKEVSVDPGE